MRTLGEYQTEKLTEFLVNYQGEIEYDLDLMNEAALAKSILEMLYVWRIEWDERAGIADAETMASEGMEGL